jgi:hypothetical protein
VVGVVSSVTEDNRYNEKYKRIESAILIVKDNRQKKPGRVKTKEL